MLVPVRDHSHETMIETVRANSAGDAGPEPEPFDPRVFEELMPTQMGNMEMDGMTFQFVGDHIDLTGDDYMTD